jgi:hypothetical protein
MHNGHKLRVGLHFCEDKSKGLPVETGADGETGDAVRFVGFTPNPEKY